jgi:hypothetical protein
MTYNFTSEYAAEAIHVKSINESIDRSTAQSDPLEAGGSGRFCSCERVWRDLFYYTLLIFISWI